jgi:predicted nucleic acid-binding protein
MTTSDNVGLLDTNVLVYAADELSPHYRHASTLQDKGLRGDL